MMSVSTNYNLPQASPATYPVRVVESENVTNPEPDKKTETLPPLPQRGDETSPPRNSAGNLSVENITDLQQVREGEPEKGANRPDHPPPPAGASPKASDAADGANSGELTTTQEAAVTELKARDLEVHAHERAHASAGGQHAGAPSYGYTTGPDGQRYATSGEVSIDLAPVSGDPKATIDKMQVVIRAALAPSQPSGQDRSVAAAAKATMIDAQAQLNAQKSGIPEETAEPVDTAINDNGEVVENIPQPVGIDLVA